MEFSTFFQEMLLFLCMLIKNWNCQCFDLLLLKYIPKSRIWVGFAFLIAKKISAHKILNFMKFIKPLFRQLKPVAPTSLSKHEKNQYSSTVSEICERANTIKIRRNSNIRTKKMHRPTNTQGVYGVNMYIVGAIKVNIHMHDYTYKTEASFLSVFL